MASPRIRVAVIDMQPISPAIGGGRLRLLGLYHALGADFETTYVGTYDWPGERRREVHLSDTLTEVDIPLSAEHFRRDAEWRAWAGGATIIDTTFPILGRLSSGFVDRARAAVAAADAVVISHPWVHPLLESAIDRGRQLLVYDSQNVEALLRYDILGDTPFGREIAKCVAATEAFLARDADLIVGCSAEDLSFYEEAYGVPRERMRLVPNGVFVDAIRPATADERAGAKCALRIAGSAVVFIGSNYAPNVEAARYIARVVAPALPDVTFLVCGGVGDADGGRGGPSANVRFTGRITDDERLELLHAADAAINPMFSGSGTNIKMFDFMAAGLPVVSTATGARGICDSSTRGVIVSDAGRFPSEVGALVADPETSRRLGGTNREWVERDFAWESLSPKLGDILRDAIARRETVWAATAEQHATRPRETLVRDGDVGPAAGMASPQRIAILSTLGIRCGIAEYATYLIEALLAIGADVMVLANELEGHEHALTATPPGLRGAAIERVWRYDNVTWTKSIVSPDDVARRLRSRGIGTLNVQYHPGFFPEAMLVELLEGVTAHGIATSVSLHNSSSTSVALLRRLEGWGTAVFVHRPSERERLRDLGVRRADFIPIGVRALPARAPNGSLPLPGGATGPVIGTFGFLRPHKGLLELVDAVDILRRVFPGVRLVAQTALYPAEDSSAYLEAVTARIAALGLGDVVFLDPDFVNIDVAIARLAAVKVVVLPYSVSDEGASAAAATALAARRPLITTQARIFDEVRGVAYMSEDNTPAVLAVAIGAVLSVPGLCAYLEARAVRAASERDWRNVALQFLRAAASDSE